MKYNPFDPQHRVAEPSQSLRGLHPRGLSMPNIVQARKAKAIGHRYVALNNREGRMRVHMDPLCTRISVTAETLDAPVFVYGDGQLIAYRGADDPIFVDECSLCAGVPVFTSEESDWKAEAACNVPGLDLSEHFLNPGSNTDYAAQLCGECPVQSQCGEYGAKLNSEQPHRATIVWGGERTMKGEESVSIHEG